MTIRGNSSIFDALGSAFVFSGKKGEPIYVDHEKDRIRGQPVDTFELIVTDVDYNRGVTITMHEAPSKEAKNDAKLLEAHKKKEEAATRRNEENDARQAKRQTRAQLDDVTLLEILATKPGLPISALRAEMAARLGECGRERVETALARQADKVRIAPGEKNSLRHFLAIGDLSAAIAAIRNPSTHPPEATPKPVTTWSEAASASAEIDETGDQ